jgi:hypothetical protein
LLITKKDDEMIIKKPMDKSLRQIDFKGNLVILLFKLKSISKKSPRDKLNGFYLRVTWKFYCAIKK